MAFAFDYVDGAVLRWSRTADGVECERDESYRPSFYVSSEADDLDDIRDHLSVWLAVERTAVEQWRQGFRHDSEGVLRIDVADLDAVTRVASDVRGYLPDVLQPLIDDRDAIKAELRETDDPERREELEGAVERDQVDSGLVFRLSGFLEREVRAHRVPRGSTPSPARYCSTRRRCWRRAGGASSTASSIPFGYCVQRMRTVSSDVRWLGEFSEEIDGEELVVTHGAGERDFLTST